MYKKKSYSPFKNRTIGIRTHNLIANEKKNKVDGFYCNFQHLRKRVLVAMNDKEDREYKEER